MASLWLIVGGGIFALMGAGHALLTMVDVFRPTQFAPTDDSVRLAMQRTGVRFTKDRANMWDAWLGFNISHGLGVFLFGAALVCAGLNLDYLTPARSALLIPVGVGLAYFVLSMRFWFYAPAVGSALATASFMAAWYCL